ncbi:MAG: hypothetical protein KZQ94_22080 [Candidatus Thiodiazotropha sp. (ex Troendleina suluensis)]|nr:hypothetical protein [Candidatus Thiodiazotropha sp. (ex Troendleina suluensis)]
MEQLSGWANSAHSYHQNIIKELNQYAARHRRRLFNPFVHRESNMKIFNYSFVAAIAIAAGCLQATTAFALDLKFSGFFNAIANRHDADEMRYLETVDDTWGFNNTSYGLNVATKISDKLSVAAQLFGGGHEGDSVGLDWAFATYDFNDESHIKFGKIKYPGNLYSETVDVGFVYPWIRPPESIYSENAKLFFEAYKGAAYKYMAGDDIEFGVEIYYGSTPEEEHEDELESHNDMMGLTVSAANDMGRLLFSYNDSVLSATDTSVSIPVAGEDGQHYSILAVGAEVEFDKLQIIAEIAQSQLEDASDEDAVGWYVTAAYSMGEWKPHFTIQKYAVDDASVEQSSMTLGVIKKVGSGALLKLEVQRIDDIKGNGFFEDHLFDTTNLPDGSSVNMFNIALSTVF